MSWGYRSTQPFKLTIGGMFYLERAGASDSKDERDDKTGHHTKEPARDKKVVAVLCRSGSRQAVIVQ